MERRPHKHDINIGQDRWIYFGDLAGGQTRAAEVDPHLVPVMPFLQMLETECVVDCCGIDAFGFWPEQIEKAAGALTEHERDTLVISLLGVQRELEQLPSDTVVSKRLNQYFLKQVFLELLAHVRSVVEGAAPASSEKEQKLPQPTKINFSRIAGWVLGPPFAGLRSPAANEAGSGVIGDGIQSSGGTAHRPAKSLGIVPGTMPPTDACRDST